MSTTTMRGACAVALGLAVIALSGCEKKVKLTFFNGTNQQRDVFLAGPGDGTGILGAVGPMGKLATKIKVDEDILPANYNWEAGDKSGTFTITKDSPGKLMIAIERGGAIGPIDENTEVKKAEKIEAKDVIIDQDTVVE